MTSTPVMVFSPSTVKKFRRCKRQYYYAVVEGLEARLPDAKLKLGGWFHDLMEAHYTGKDWEKTHKRLVKEFNNLFIEEREMYGDMPDQVERMMRGYLHYWKKEDEDWEILYAEQEFEAQMEGGDYITFKPDLIVRDHSTPQEFIWVVDHKTVRSIPSADWRAEDLQSTLYFWALRELGLEVKGFIYNYVRKKAPTVPKINKDGSISKRRIDTDFYTLATFLKEYFEVDSLNDLPPKWKKQLHALKLHSSFLKRTRYIPTAATVERTLDEFSYTAQEMEIWHEMGEEQEIDPWTRTFEPSCEWSCDFHDLCMTEFLGGDGRFMRRSKYQPSKYVEERDLGRTE